MEKLPPMVDMRRSGDMGGPGGYPYGLCINLGNEELEKLGLDPKDCEIGDMIHMHALCKVTSVSCDEREDSDGPCHRIELTITHIADEPESEDAENAAVEKKMKPGLRGLYN